MSRSSRSYLSGATPGTGTGGALQPDKGLTQAQVDARVKAGVQDWAEHGNNQAIPFNKLTDVYSKGETKLEITTDINLAVAPWAQRDNHDPIPASKLTNAGGSSSSSGGLTEAQVDARVRRWVQDWAEAGNTDNIPDSKLTGINRIVDNFFNNNVFDWAKVGNDDRIPLSKAPDINPAINARIADWAEVGNSEQIPASKLANAPAGAGGGLTQAQVDERVKEGVLDWAEKDNEDPIPASKLSAVDTPLRVSMLSLTAPTGRTAYLIEDIVHPRTQHIYNVPISYLAAEGASARNQVYGASIINLSAVTIDGHPGPQLVSDTTGYPSVFGGDRIAAIWQNASNHFYVAVAKIDAREEVPTLLVLDPSEGWEGLPIELTKLTEITVVTDTYIIAKSTQSGVYFANRSGNQNNILYFALRFGSRYMMPNGLLEDGIDHEAGHYIKTATEWAPWYPVTPIIAGNLAPAADPTTKLKTESRITNADQVVAFVKDDDESIYDTGIFEFDSNNILIKRDGIINVGSHVSYEISTGQGIDDQEEFIMSIVRKRGAISKIMTINTDIHRHQGGAENTTISMSTAFRVLKNDIIEIKIKEAGAGRNQGTLKYGRISASMS